MLQKQEEGEKYFQGVYQGPDGNIKLVGVFRNSKSSVNPIKYNLICIHLTSINKTVYCLL